MTLADIERLAQDRPDLFYTRSGCLRGANAPGSARDAIDPENTLDTAQSQGA